MRGFSLVELSIVLVILGLLVGGVMAGKSLIRAAEIRSLGTDLQKLQAATYAFRDKYFYLPGDIPNAHSFWTLAGGVSAPYSSGCLSANVAPTNPGTCNGNGDGFIYYSHESLLVMEHLALAGLINGSYAGGNQSGTAYAKALVRGVNIYPTRLDNVAVQAAYRSAYGQARNYFIVGGNTHTGTLLVDPAIKSEEALNLDTKMDDGLASYGKLVAGNGNNGGSYPAWCTSGWRIDQDAPGPIYFNLGGAIAGNGCMLYFQP